MYILFKDATLITMNDEDINNRVLIPKAHHNLLVKDDLIDFIGDDESLASYIKDIKIDKTIDCDGNVVMPGFVNAHAHAPMTFVRNYADNLPLDEWLNNKIFPLEAKLTDDDVYWFTKLAILEQIASGITSSAEMYYHLPYMAKAAVELNYRVILNDAVMSFNTKEASEEAYLTLNNFEGDKQHLVRFMLGLHSIYTNNENSYKFISELIHKYKAPLMIHNSETKKEVINCRMQYGTTPTQLLDRYGLLDFGGNHAHCVYLNDKDIDLFIKYDIKVAINLASNLKLGNGICDFRKYLKRNLKLAIGTDGVSSNNALDMFREMYLITLCAKMKCGSLNAIDPSETLIMATRNGAAANYDDTIGRLAVGLKADIIEIDMHDINLTPVNDIVHSLVYSAGKHNIKLTMVNGKILYEDKKYKVDADVDEIVREVRKRAEDIKVR